jgi:hypothetical protein
MLWLLFQIHIIRKKHTQKQSLFGVLFTSIHFAHSSLIQLNGLAVARRYFSASPDQKRSFSWSVQHLTIVTAKISAWLSQGDISQLRQTKSEVFLGLFSTLR